MGLTITLFCTLVLTVIDEVMSNTESVVICDLELGEIGEIEAGVTLVRFRLL